MDYNGWVEIPTVPVIIVEGAYSQYPQFGHYADLTAFCDITPEEQKRRITARNGEEHWMVFREQWIPLEEKYLAEYHIKENSMLTV